MTDLWVSYAVIDSEGSHLMLASCVVSRPDPIKTETEVLRLADDITAAQRERGRIPSGAHAGIVSWSEMGA